MLKKILNGIASIVLLSISGFFVLIITYLVSSEIMPALRQGSLNVETSVMILNRVWEGNQIYLLLTVYALIACATAYGAVRIGARVFRRQ